MKFEFIVWIDTINIKSKSPGADPMKSIDNSPIAIICVTPLASNYNKTSSGQTYLEICWLCPGVQDISCTKMSFIC